MSSEIPADRLIWVDLEMTGLDPLTHHVVEIATLVTDGSLSVVAEGPDLVIAQPESVLDGLNDWSREHHTASGLLDRVRESRLGVAEAEARTLEFLARYCPPGQAPLAGNSVHMDRFFLRLHMPKLEAFAHYRNVDVTSIKELVRRWYPRVFAGAPRKSDSHRALEDLRESVAELRYYRERVFRVPESAQPD
jgi:oligoribonuclease